MILLSLIIIFKSIEFFLGLKFNIFFINLVKKIINFQLFNLLIITIIDIPSEKILEFNIIHIVILSFNLIYYLYK